MNELFHAAFSGVNIIPTVLLILVLLYWIFVIIGAMDMDAITIDMDAEADAGFDVDAGFDLDAEADLDTDPEAHSVVSVTFLNSVLTFFNLGRIPFMVWLSFLIIPLWVLSILFNHYLHNSSVLLALLALIPIAIISLMLSKILTQPVAALFEKINQNDDDKFLYTGKVCTVLMPAGPDRFGQAEIKRDGNAYRVNIIIKAGGVSLEKGQSALIIEYLADKKCYLVEPYKI